MRSGLAAFTLAFVAGTAAVLVWAAADKRDLAFTLGVVPGQVAVELRPGQEACQSPVPVAESFTRVRFQVGTHGRGGQPLSVSVRPAAGGAPLGSGTLAPGYADGSQPVVRVGRVPDEREVSVCIRNSGGRPLSLYGGPRQAAPSRVLLDGRPRDVDLTLVFLRDRSRSALSLVPAVFERASLFHPGWVGAWTFWLLAAAVLLGVPLLLGAALRSAAREDA